MKPVSTVTGVLCLVSAIATARAKPVVPPVAQALADVNGDGKPDTIQLKRPGGLNVVIRGHAQPLWTSFATSGQRLERGSLATKSGAAYGHQVVIIAEAIFSGGIHEALVATIRQNKLVVLWRGTLGAQGPDQDWHLALEAHAKGLLLYGQRTGITRCDGAKARLYPRAFDWNAGKFRSIASFVQRPTKTGLSLVATMRVPNRARDSRATLFRAQAASSQRHARNPSELRRPVEIDDGRMTTAWFEGSGGYGRGEFVNFIAPQAESIAGIRITPGAAANTRALRDSNRLQHVLLVTDDGRAYPVKFSRDPGRSAPGTTFWIPVPAGVRAKCVSLVIDGVYKGRISRQSAIAEAAVYTTLELTSDGGFAIRVAELETDGPRARRAERILSRMPPSTLPALQKQAIKTPRLRHALRRIYAQIANGATGYAPAPLLAGLRDPLSPPADFALFATTLAQSGQTQVLVQALSAQLPEAARLAIIRRLAVDPATRAQLIPSLGHGSPAARKAVVLALAQAPFAEISKLGTTVTGPRAQADFLRIIRLQSNRTKQSPSEHKRIIAASREVLERALASTDYEVLYRAIELSARGGASRLAVLGKTLGRQPRSAQSNALHRIAATSLGGNPHGTARGLLTEWLTHHDIGVRRRAARSLAENLAARKSAMDTTSDAALLTMATGDPWPSGRKSAITALRHRCQHAPKIPRALYSLMDNDRVASVQVASLRALVACGARGVTDKVFSIAKAAQRPKQLRLAAVAVVPRLRGDNMTRTIALLQQSINEMTKGSELGLRLAVATAGALGALNNTRAVTPLTQLARNPRFPRLQAAGLDALANYCPSDLTDTLADVTRHPRTTPIARAAARRARKRCSER